MKDEKKIRVKRFNGSFFKKICGFCKIRDLQFIYQKRKFQQIKI